MIRISLASLAALAFLTGGECFAQGTSLFGSLGPTSQSSQGGVRSSSGSSSGFGTASPFSSGFGNQSTTGSQMGSTAFGNNTLGGNQSPGYSSNQARTSNIGGAQGQPGAAGGAQSLGRNGTNRFGSQGLGGNRLGQNGLQRNGQNQQQQMDQQGLSSQAQQQQVRIRPQVSFPYQGRATATVNSSLQLSFNRITARGPDFANLQFATNGAGEVTLKGTVPNEQAARVAAALVRLEPGVRTVRNETTVGGAAATTSSSRPQ